MNTWQAIVKRIWSDFGSVCAELEVSQSINVIPGQYLLTNPALQGYSELPDTVFPTHNAGSRIRIAPPIPTSWEPGFQLNGKGPQGNGFHIPAQTRKLSLVCYHPAPQLILGLERLVRSTGCETNLFWNRPADIDPILPLQSHLEVVSITEVEEAFLWADYVAIDIPIQNLPEILLLRDKLGSAIHGKPIEILIRIDMPCGGIGECGICSIPTHKKSWKLACKDGPVFRLNELAGEAG